MREKYFLSALLLLASALPSQALAQTGFDIELKCFVFDYRDGEFIEGADVKLTAAGKPGESRRVGNFYLSTVSLEKKPSEPIRVSIVPPAGFAGRAIELNSKVAEKTRMFRELRIYLVRTGFAVTEEALLKAARQLDRGQFSKALAPLEFAHERAQDGEALSWLSVFRIYRYASALQYMCRERDYATCEKAKFLYQSLGSLYNSPTKRDLFGRSRVSVDKIRTEEKHIRDHLARRYEEKLVAEFQVAAELQLRPERCGEAAEIYSKLWDEYDNNAEIWKKNGIRKWTVVIDLGKASLNYAEYLRDRPEPSSQHEIFEYVAKGVFFLNSGVQLMGQRPVDSGAIDKSARIEGSLRRNDYSFDAAERAKWILSNRVEKGLLRVSLPKSLVKGEETHVKAEILRLESKHGAPEAPEESGPDSERLKQIESEIPVTDKMEVTMVPSSKLTMTKLSEEEQRIPAVWQWKVEAKEPGNAQPVLERAAYVRIADKQERQVLEKVSVEPITLEVQVKTPVAEWPIWQILGGGIVGVIGLVFTILAYFRSRSSNGPTAHVRGAQDVEPPEDEPQHKQEPSRDRGAGS